METTVDWWARVIGGAGLLLAGLGLILQYRRHRFERPKLSLKVVVRDPSSDADPWELVLTLTNRGGSDAGISTFRIDATTHRFNFVERPTTAIPQGHVVPARNHFTWKMELWPVYPDRATAAESIAFHRRLRFDLLGEPTEEGVAVVADYFGPGMPRVVFLKSLL
jgi:hypothetical protein